MLLYKEAAEVTAMIEALMDHLTGRAGSGGSGPGGTGPRTLKLRAFRSLTLSNGQLELFGHLTTL
jgi:hypothetical protein